MNQVLDQYKALPAPASSGKTSVVLSSILVALATNQLGARSRETLTQLILDDLKVTLLYDGISRLSKDDALQALSIIKSLGSTQEVSVILGTPSNLRALLSLSAKIDDSLHNDALRCIANTVLLNESARITFVGPEVNGGRPCVDLLQKSTVEHVFLASRILFLCTAVASSAGPFIQWLVEHQRPTVLGSGTAIDVIGTKLDDLIELMKEGNTTPRDAVTDLLKLIFNLCAHYPKIVDCEIQSPEVTNLDPDSKVMGDYWSARLDSLLPPLLRAFHLSIPASNPLEAPMPHVIHSLITIPILPTNRNIWFGNETSAPTLPDSAGSSGSSSSTPTFISRLVSGPDHRPPSGYHRLPSATISYDRLPLTVSLELQDSALRAYELLDATLAYFMPGDINADDPSVRNRLPDGESLDDLITPLAILITHFCLGDEDVKIKLRNWFIPSTLDRSKPLETRADLLGRCLRLLQSIYHSRLNRICGEMFFAMCDCDATTLSGYLGYGNVAGFLFQKELPVSPGRLGTSGAPTTTATGLPIDPITGTIEREHEPTPMTDEEKEQEAEKLFVLFDRMEKTGAIQASQNPLRRAIQEGKLG